MGEPEWTIVRAEATSALGQASNAKGYGTHHCSGRAISRFQPRGVSGPGPGCSSPTTAIGSPDCSSQRASDAIAGAVRNDITQEIHQPLYELLLAADVPTTVAGYPDVSQ